jgi:hypothetical protein
MVVFLCGTYADLKTERQAVLAVVSELQHQHQAMEFFGARPGRPIETCLEEVRASDLLVVILGNLYGSLIPGEEVSYTEAEYEEGYGLAKKCLIYMRDEEALVSVRYMEQDPVKLTKLTKFRTTVAERHTIVRFRDATDLARKVEGDLKREAQRAPGPPPRR